MYTLVCKKYIQGLGYPLAKYDEEESAVTNSGIDIPILANIEQGKEREKRVTYICNNSYL